jgi:chromosome segregation ATPase
VTEQNSSFVTQQINFYKRSIGKLALSDDIKRKIDSELNALGTQLDSVFNTNKSKLAESTKELQDLRVKVSKLSRDLTRSEKNSLDVAQKLELKEQSYKTNLTELNTSVENLQHELRENKRKLSTATSDLQKKDLLLNNQEGKISNLELENQDFQERIQPLKKEIISFTKQKNSIDLLLKQQENTIKSKDLEIEKINTNLSKLKSKHNSLVAEFQKNEQRSKLLISSENKLKQEVATLNSSNDNLNKNFSKLKQDYDTIEQKLRNQDITIKELESRISSTKDEQSSTRMGLAYAKKELEEMKESLNKKKEKDQMSEKDIEDLQQLIGDYSKAQERIAKLEKENLDLENSLESNNQVIKNSTNKGSQLKQENDKLREENESYSKEINSYKTTAANKARAISDLGSSLNDLNEELSQIKAQLNVQNKELSILKEENAGLKIQNNEQSLQEKESLDYIAEENKNLKKETEKTLDKILQLEGLISNLNKEKEISDKEIKQLEDLISDKSGQIKKYENEISTLNLENQDNLQTELEKKNRKIEEIEDQLARVSTLYTDLSSEDNFEDKSLAIFNIYSTLVEKLYEGQAHGRILFLLHSPKELWTKQEISKATGISNLATLRSIHELARAKIIEWDENNETVRLFERFLS